MLSLALVTWVVVLLLDRVQVIRAFAQQQWCLFAGPS